MSRLKSAKIGEFGTVFSHRQSKHALEELFTEIDDYFETGVTVRAGDTVFDVGANIGAFAIVAAQRCHGDLAIHCFEPAPALFSALSENARVNPWLKKARHELHNLALAAPEDAGKTASLYYFERLPTDSTMDMEQKRREFRQFFEHKAKVFRTRVERRVPGRVGRAIGRAATTGMDLWLASRAQVWVADKVTGVQHVECKQDAMSRVVARHKIRRIDLLKVDVEGFELKVLEGIDRDTWPLIRQVAIETDGRPEQTEAILRILKDAGFDAPRMAPTKVAHERGLANLIVSAVRS